MKGPGRSALAVARTGSGDEQPPWALVGEGSLTGSNVDRITTRELEALPLDRQVVRHHVDQVMVALDAYGAHLVATPGGAGWLYVQHVPARRLVTQLVRKLMALSTWDPFAKTPGPLALAPYEGLVGLRPSSSREYRAYTVTWSGVAYALGAPAPHSPLRSPQLRSVRPVRGVRTAPSPPPSVLPRTEVVALSWSSRHAATLLPVLEALACDGRDSVVVDLATDPAERCADARTAGVALCSPPPGLFSRSEVLGRLRVPDDGEVVQVQEHSIRLARLVRLVSVLLETSGGCTQPSWSTVVRAETWLDEVLTAANPHTLLVSNDTSPLGALAVHTAHRHDVNTVHVQHGAWAPESVAWPALHSRNIVVMGERDVPLARAWARHPRAEVHVLGQPRFDVLTALSRRAQRRYLQKLLASPTGRAPARIAVWACQPTAPDSLRAQADLLRDALRRADGNWGLVVAPHPAQSTEALSSLLPFRNEPLAAVADARVGGRGCLAGADLLVSAYSTCGIEAVLLNVPVLEIGALDEQTLGLAEHGLALRCTTAAEVADALSELSGPRPLVPQVLADAVCRWRGDSATEIARLLVSRARAHSPNLNHTHREACGAEPWQPTAEGAPAS